MTATQEAQSTPVAICRVAIIFTDEAPPVICDGDDFECGEYGIVVTSNHEWLAHSTMRYEGQCKMAHCYPWARIHSVEVLSTDQPLNFY